MRKRNKKLNIFSRTKAQRVAMMESLSESLFLHGKITTSEAKAKELKSYAEKFITRAKNNTIANKRVLTEALTPVVVKKLTSEIAPQYAQRNGGYTRVTKLGPRKSDGAPMAIIELVK